MEKCNQHYCIALRKQYKHNLAYSHNYWTLCGSRKLNALFLSMLANVVSWPTIELVLWNKRKNIHWWYSRYKNIAVATSNWIPEILLYVNCFKYYISHVQYSRYRKKENVYFETGCMLKRQSSALPVCPILHSHPPDISNIRPNQQLRGRAVFSHIIHYILLLASGLFTHILISHCIVGIKLTSI